MKISRGDDLSINNPADSKH